eukprot:CAMPEP_0202918784 /NCGR_PEP_ID=MMETSP1392-20130828/74247_1 /ASSEMBLY_ACC=CAM_ASM_000868 /TAXON_ID=225041 /ORGANISM="Chlamydomonas chlamydogama, Strain SAG 11-48b" /LENGTH=153 /DNA_ID=CAMNT_0049611937 /DNA_START=248 /DNA_END=706 /DNA_ORIENTATION=+
MGDITVRRGNANDSTLFKYSADQWSRQRGARTTFVDLSEDERQELQECFEALDEMGRGYIDYTNLIKAADMVLGQGNYRVQGLKQAMTEMDLNRNGRIVWHEFRAYMSLNWTATKDAVSVMMSNSATEEMIMVGPNTRLADLFKAYRRRIMVE